MVMRRRKSIRRSLVRTFFVGISTIAYLAGVIGFPLPAYSERDLSQPFPCQNHPCGCRNADECWRHCCCFTPAERWAWARANHVEPPSYAERPISEDSGRPLCCVHREHQVAHAEPASPACCSTAGHESSCCKTRSHLRSDKGKSSPRWILAMVSQQCQGATSQWLGGGTAVPPPPVVTWSPAWPLVGKLSYADRSSSSQAPTPPDPPPRSNS